VVISGKNMGMSADYTLDFVDLRDLVGKYIGMSFQFLTLLKGVVSSNPKYNGMSVIKSVVDPTNPSSEKDSPSKFFALMGQDVKNQDLGFLIFFASDGLGVLGMFAEKNIIDNFKNKKDVVKMVLSFFVQAPEYWKSVNLMLPLQQAT